MTTLPNITTVAMLKDDRTILSKLKRIRNDGLLESDWEVIHRLLDWQRKTRKQKILDLLPSDFDPTLVEEALRE